MTAAEQAAGAGPPTGGTGRTGGSAAGAAASHQPRPLSGTRTALPRVAAVQLATGPATPRMRLRGRPDLIRDGRRVLVRLDTLAAVLDGLDDLVEEVLGQLSGVGVEVPALCLLMKRRFGPAGARRTAAIVEALSDAGLLEPVPADITVADLARFAALLDFLADYEDAVTSRFELLRRVRAGRVAVLGTGGTGSWVCHHLVGVGVGQLTLIDSGVLDPAGVAASALSGDPDIGQLTVEAARRGLLRYASRTLVRAHPVHVDGPDRLAALADGADLLVCCADPPAWPLPEWATRAGRAVGIPVLAVTSTRVGPLYVPRRSSCRLCHPAGEQPRPSAPTPTGPLVAGPAAVDVLRHLTGYARPASWNAVLQVSADRGSTARAWPPRAGCVGCGGPDTFTPRIPVGF